MRKLLLAVVLGVGLAACIPTPNERCDAWDEYFDQMNNGEAPVLDLGDCVL